MAKKNLPPTTYPPATPERSDGGRGNLQPKAGFAMLFSVLISSLLVVIGLSIFSITLKELAISTSARESQIAFYAANSGMECALYWDLKQNAFATTTNIYEDARVGGITANCDGARVNSSYSKTGQKTKTIASFPVISSTDTEGPCADINVIKEEIAGKMTTTIESQGKNICGASGRRVERGLRASITKDM